MESLLFLLLAVCVLGFGFVSKRVQTSSITPPMVFVLFGLLVGPVVLDLQGFQPDSEWIHVLAELTLVLVLFTDASRIDLRLLRKEHDLPVRLLTMGMPMTIALGTLIAFFCFDGLGFWGAAILAIILAPTDAALGQIVVTNPRVPVRIRQTLNVESGLNDGIALPILLIFLCAGEVSHNVDPGYWIRFVTLQLTLGPLIGVLVGLLGGKLVEICSRTGWMNRTFQDLSALGLSLLAYSGAELAGGNGFIAAFAAGLTLGNFSRAICTCLYEFAEAEGQLLTLLVFVIFGAVLVPVGLEHLTWKAGLYAVLSLTLIRMIPVALSLLGTGLSRSSVVFLGWFGPRGIASILFALLVLNESHLPIKEEILGPVVITVFLSIFAHGISAYPGTSWYAFMLKGLPGKTHEHKPVTEMPVRIAHHD